MPGLLCMISKFFENREEKENHFKNLINREENEIFSLKILKIREEKENLVSESHKSRKERELGFQFLENREEK